MGALARLLALLLALQAPPAAANHRTYSGTGNNIAQPTLGASGALQSAGLMGGAMSASTAVSGGPNARNVSSTVCERLSALEPAAVNQLHVAVGLLAAIDSVESMYDASSSLNVAVPTCDARFDPACTGAEELAGQRLAGPFNNASAYLDASFLYGSSDAEDAFDGYRTYEGGMWNLSAWIEGNPMVSDDGSSYVFLNYRSNFTPLTASLVTVLMREHNLRADLYGELDDEDAFQYSRRWVTALWQRIVVYEYLPLLIGAELDPYAGYDDSVDPSVDVFFSAAAARYGHSATSSTVYRAEADFSPSLDGELPLSDCFLSPAPWVEEFGIGAFIRGAMAGWARAVDTRLDEELQYFHEGYDVASIDIMRGRDLGLPTYGDACAALGISSACAGNWTALVGEDDPETAALLAHWYDSVASVDSWLAGIAERPVGASTLGPLFSAVYVDHFSRLRAGDRFWFEADGWLEEEELLEVQGESVADLLRRHVDMDCYHEDGAFVAVAGCASSGTVRSLQPVEGYTFQWTLRETDDEIDVAVFVDGGMMIGVGLGSGMENVDIVLFQTESAEGGIVTDMYSESYMPVPDSMKGGADEGNVFNTWYEVIDGFVSAGFTRKLTVTDPYDTEMIAGANDMIFAVNFDDNYAYHGRSQRTKARIDLLSGEATIEDSDKFYYFHGLSMIFFWGVCIPFGAFVARYAKHSPLWLWIHLVTGRVGASGALSLGLSALLVRDAPISQLHHVIGILLVTLVVAEVWIGNAMRSGLKKHSHTCWHRYSRRIHKYFGWLLALVGLFNIPLGMKLLLPQALYSTLVICALCYYGLIVVGVLYMEGKLLSDSGTELHADREGDLSSEFQNLQAYTWHEVAEHARHGFAWVVVQSVVVDLSDWVLVHPGGPGIIQSVAGTDVTREFNGDSTLGHHTHRHSVRARKVMLSRVVGRLVPGDEESRESTESMFRFSLANIERLGGTEEKPHMLSLRLSSIQPGHERVLDANSRFISHVTVLSLGLHGQIVERSFTPLNGLVWNTEAEARQPQGLLKLLIGIYPSGEMSQILLGLHAKDHVRVLGPTPTMARVEPPQPRGCWPHLALICGGTGVVPMLQVLSHHLSHAPGRGCGGVISLVVCVRSEVDLAASQANIDAARAWPSCHSLRVTYVVSKPGPDWKGHSGYVTSQLFEAELPPPVAGFTTHRQRSESRRSVVSENARLLGGGSYRRPKSGRGLNLKQKVLGSLFAPSSASTIPEQDSSDDSDSAPSAAPSRSRSRSKKSSGASPSPSGPSFSATREIEMEHVNPMANIRPTRSTRAGRGAGALQRPHADEDLHLFVCGPPGFNARCMKKLLALGYSRECLTVL